MKNFLHHVAIYSPFRPIISDIAILVHPLLVIIVTLLGQQTLLHGSLQVLSNIFVVVEPEPQNLSSCGKVQRSGSKIHSIESRTLKYYLRNVSSIEILLANNFLILDMVRSLSVWYKVGDTLRQHKLGLGGCSFLMVFLSKNYIN